MSKHYNVVISINFSDESEQEDYIRFIKGLKGAKVLYTGVHDNEVYQKVITQKSMGES